MPSFATNRLPLQTSPALDRIVRRCLQKLPSQRFQTMGELRAVLEQPATEPSTPIERVPSIAVLPFANMSADKENEYFSDGLAEEIINVLANVPGLKVAGRTSSFFFRGKDVEFARDRQEAQRRPHSGRECSKGRQPHPRHGAAHQGRRWFSSLVGALRPRD